MKKILLIKCSVNNKTPKGSISAHALDFFKSEYIKKNPNDQIIEKDLNKISFLKTSLTDESLDTWFDNDAKELINELKSVDNLIIASSMTNFSYPGLLKNYLDKICLANETFKFKYNNGKGGSEGLLTNLTTSFILSQGSPVEWYPFSALPNNLIGLFEFLGSSTLKPIMIDGTKTPENIDKSAEETIEPYKNQIIDLVNKIN